MGDEAAALDAASCEIMPSGEGEANRVAAEPSEIATSETSPAADELVTSAESAAAVAAPSRQRLARQILQDGRVALLTYHVSGVSDNATARQNILDTASGRQARRSSYGNAPGGRVWLADSMLRAVVGLSRSRTFRVTEFAGGSHSRNSNHYRGTAFDCDVIDGQRVSGSHRGVRAFMAACRRLGAREVLGPGDPGHATHIHAAW